MKTKFRTLVYFSSMVVFAYAALIFLAMVGEAALVNQHPFQFFADSNTYHEIYRGSNDLHSGSLIGVASNYLGPMTLLTIAGGNPYLILVINIVLYVASLLLICRALQLDVLRVGCLLLLSPLTVSTLLSVNKEIFALPFAAVALLAYQRRSLGLIVLALSISLLMRWQLALFYLVLVGISAFRIAGIGRKTVLVGLLLGISAAYAALSDFLEPVIKYSEASIESYDEGGSGLFEYTLSLQSSGLYFLVFPMKALHLMFGLGLKFGALLNPGNIYNDLFVGWHSLIALGLGAVLAWRRQLTIRNDLVFVSVVFLVIFCITPVFAPRYLYPVYLLWVLVLAGAPATLTTRSRRPVPGTGATLATTARLPG